MENKRVDAFEAALEPILPDDTRQLNELTIGVTWPHRMQDIQMLQSLGRGYIIRDQIARPIGSGMYFPVSADLHTIGMMITTPRLQAAGAGRWILQRLLEESDSPGYLLNSTRKGFGLYLREGFKPIRSVSQHQGIVRQIPAVTTPSGIDIRPITAKDITAIAAFDAPCFGADRSDILDILWSMDKTGTIALRNGNIAGYVIVRNFGRGRVVGPIVAETEQLAISLVQPHIKENVGQFLRVDSPCEDTGFNAFLESCGILLFDKVIEMHKGRVVRGNTPSLFGLAAQAIG